MFYNLFLYGIIDWIFKNIPIRNSGWGLEWFEYVRNGGLVTCVRLLMMGEGVKILSFWYVHTN